MNQLARQARHRRAQPVIGNVEAALELKVCPADGAAKAFGEQRLVDMADDGMFAGHWRDVVDADARGLAGR